MFIKINDDGTTTIINTELPLPLNQQITLLDQPVVMTGPAGQFEVGTEEVGVIFTQTPDGPVFRAVKEDTSGADAAVRATHPTIYDEFLQKYLNEGLPKKQAEDQATADTRAAVEQARP